MEFMTRLLGAFVVTYVLSRLLFRVFGPRAKRELAFVIGTHLATFAVIAITVGLIRAYWTSFNWMAAAPYVVPQLVWLAIDLGRMRSR